MAFFKTSDGVSINYQVHQGNDQGKTALLLAGFSGIQAEWQYQIETLKAQGFCVVTMDWRSHGRSARTSKNLRISRLAADLKELIDRLNLSDLLVIGHSMGAAVIWAYLSLFGEAAFRQAVFIDQSPKLLNDETWTAGLLGLNWTSFPVLSETFFHQKMTVAPVSQAFKDKLKQEKIDYPFDFDLAFPLLKDHLLSDWRENLSACGLAKLFVAGGASPLWKHQYYHDFLDDLKGGQELVVIPGTGHLPHLEKPEKFSTILHDFVTK
ncbi:alpha/beta hydrolase [Fructobacillus sp. M1-13]|uniref:Alpha/beta hydrolase n=1 Tax=Fructobacillus papyriferae TaxID=2713171 RepID=A0ABS5QRG8_9LACO|nr:alpha/beta hydrolase [Fructobacillus papyriferae]MBS9334557.1 alpha/beta hydrolase [Fructobacillus papyriferae]MCD2158546.1 alpha/beta hydrolase [Fructobacillus papyriferae]